MRGLWRHSVSSCTSFNDIGYVFGSITILLHRWRHCKLYPAYANWKFCDCRRFCLPFFNYTKCEKIITFWTFSNLRDLGNCIFSSCWSFSGSFDWTLMCGGPYPHWHYCFLLLSHIIRFPFFLSFSCPDFFCRPMSQWCNNFFLAHIHIVYLYF